MYSYICISLIAVEIKVVTPSSTTTIPVMSTTSTLSTVSSYLTSSIPTKTFQTPVFVFPTVNPFVLHLKTAYLNVTINCTVAWEGESSQLTTMWFYNGTMINNSQKYIIIEGGLLIRKITPQDVGTYECIVKHPSGWNDSRQYFISVKGKIRTPNYSAQYYMHLYFQMVNLYNREVKEMNLQRIYHCP